MKILYVTTISLTMNSFFKPHIQMLIEEGHAVSLACNSMELELDKFYRELGCKAYQISFSRKPLSKDNIVAYKELKKLVNKEEFDIVHCHTPNASVCTRLACRKLRKKGLKVFYTAHGFHFYKGAPLFNWLVFYPIEKWCSKYTDKLITINQEDYELAKKKMEAKEVCYLPGVGIDISRFDNIDVDFEKKRAELGVPREAFLVLSVGELNRNKNHEVIIRAISKIKDVNMHYMIAGEGELKKYLAGLANELGVSDRVHLLGYRKDVTELCKVADVFAFPSKREGLGLAAIEAMAAGLPIITSNVHGINDYSDNGKTGYKCDPENIEAFSNALKGMLVYGEKLDGLRNSNMELAKRYELSNVIKVLRNIYELND